MERSDVIFNFIVIFYFGIDFVSCEYELNSFYMFYRK